MFAKLLSEGGVLLAEGLVFLLETLGNVLQCDIALHLSLLIRVDPSLEICQLGLLALAKGSLRGSGEERVDETGRDEGLQSCARLTYSAPVFPWSLAVKGASSQRVSNGYDETSDTRTSVGSSTGGAGGSFLGFLPGFGLAGMTHSLEAIIDGCSD